MPKKLAVFASGSGTLFEAMIKAGILIEFLVTDRECRAEKVARSKGVHMVRIPRTFGRAFDQDRKSYTEDLLTLLRVQQIELVAMAGYMTILDGLIFAPGAYEGKILNIHPSLLPDFKGDHAVRDALAAGVTVTGTTIHWATAKLDDGPILVQEGVPVMTGDTVESLHERIKEVERVLYPMFLKRLME